MTSPEIPKDQPFRFAVNAALAPDGTVWRDLARKSESLGFSTLLLPDAPRQTPGLFPTLAWAAAATTTLQVGSYVLATDLHHPLDIAHDVATLHALSGGRFQLGLGAGRPGSEHDARARGQTPGTPSERFSRFRESVSIISGLLDGGTITREDGPFPMTGASLRISIQEYGRPRLMIAASGDRMLRFAGSVADIVALGLDPAATAEVIASKIALVRAGAAGRPVELSLSLLGAGDTIHPWVVRRIGEFDPTTDTPALLLGSVDEMVAKLYRLRDELGITSIVVPDLFVDQVAPVLREVL
jgi:probable F420-dependent oxidoreductase